MNQEILEAFAPVVEQIVASFWSGVIVPEDPDACWGWKRSLDTDGYAQMSRFGMRAHRVSFMVHHGRIPEDRPFVCHTCDNRVCSNPRHLIAGTPADNMEHRNQRGRWKNGYTNRTHCKRGHAIVEGNRHHAVGATGRPYIKCRTCHLERAREASNRFNQRKRAQREATP